VAAVFSCFAIGGRQKTADISSIVQFKYTATEIISVSQGAVSRISAQIPAVMIKRV
jgi:hypothetical protein